MLAAGNVGTNLKKNVVDFYYDGYVLTADGVLKDMESGDTYENIRKYQAGAAISLDNKLLFNAEEVASDVESVWIRRGFNSSLGNWGEVNILVKIIKTDGTLWGMGDNSRGFLGDGSKIDSEESIKIADDVVQTGEDWYIKSNGDYCYWNSDSPNLIIGQTKYELFYYDPWYYDDQKTCCIFSLKTDQCMKRCLILSTHFMILNRVRQMNFGFE
jgi:hypothetical protein